MSKAEDLTAKAARLRARAEQAPSSTSGTSRELTTPTDHQISADAPHEVSRSVGTDLHVAPRVRTRAVRLTVDVSPAEHAALSRLALDAAAELGLARVYGQEIVRTLIRRVLADPQLRQDVLADVAEHRRTS